MQKSLIDHAWGYEPCGMAEIKSYKPSTNSISEGQVLTCPYPNDKAKLIVREMAEILMFRLTEKKLVTESITLEIGYDREERGQGRLSWSDPDRPLRQNHPQGCTRHRPVWCPHQFGQYPHQRKRKAV